MSFLASAQDVDTQSPYADSITVTESYDADVPDIQSDTILEIRQIAFPADSLRRWKREADYAYMAKIDSLLHKEKQQWEKEQRKVTRYEPNFLDRLLGFRFFTILLWIIAIAVVGFLAYKLFLGKGIFERSSRERIAVQEINEAAAGEAINDWPNAIQQAAAKGDYRLAIRYQFLYTLQQLEAKQRLHLSPDKTNYGYVTEIHASLRPAFAALVLRYEFAWYGKMPVTDSQYRETETLFHQFRNNS
jgi:hypothetical protein